MLFLALSGCGPLQAPMPLRPDAEGQKIIDEAWREALRPVDRYGHQALLDVLMLTKAYEAGVDKLTFRSEKKVDDVRVVMEVHYDRLAPAADRFDIQMLDQAGRQLRKERYTREEVEQTYRELFVEYEQLRQRARQGAADAREARKLAALEARLRPVEGVVQRHEQK
jgi:hypothetical protein